MKQRLYIFSDSILKRKNNTIFFKAVARGDDDEDFLEDEETKEEYFLSKETLITTGENKNIPIESIDSIYAIGTTNFNSQFLYFLNRHRIPLHVFSYRGSYAGSFLPAERLFSGAVIIKQAEFYRNEKKRLYIAKQFISAAVHNTIANLRYHNNRGKNVADSIEYIKDLAHEVNLTESVHELMGYEGIIKRAYYDAWNTIFNYPVNFKQRVKNTPSDMINSLISYGNMIVYGLVLNEIYQTRIYPEIGFLHEPDDSKLSLAYDIAEIFKPLLTDRIIFKVINMNILSDKDFSTRNGFCRIRKVAKQKYAKEFENKINTKIYFENIKKRISYRRLVREECYKLLRHFNNEEQYFAFRAKW